MRKSRERGISFLPEEGYGPLYVIRRKANKTIRCICKTRRNMVWDGESKNAFYSQAPAFGFCRSDYLAAVTISGRRGYFWGFIPNAPSNCCRYVQMDTWDEFCCSAAVMHEAIMKNRKAGKGRQTMPAFFYSGRGRFAALLKNLYVLGVFAGQWNVGWLLAAWQRKGY